MTLSNEDLNLIAQIDARLKHYNLIQPIDTTEGEQEQGKEWKVGEWVKVVNGGNGALAANGVIGLVMQKPSTKPSNYGGEVWEIKAAIYIDSPNGYVCGLCNGHILSKPTTEEIQAHLVAIAENKYPVGSMFKDLLLNQYKYKVLDHNFKYYSKGEIKKLSVNGFSVWLNGKWAELAPIETEQRWKPEKGQLYYYVNFTQKDKIGSFTWVPDETDVDFYELGNCFETKEAAQKAAEAIKQYLSNNKF